MAVAMKQAKPKIPFRRVAVRRTAPLPMAIPWAAGGNWRVEVPATGLLSGIYLNMAGTMTIIGGAGALTAWGPWDILSRIRVTVNAGGTVVYDTSGYGNYLLNRTRYRGHDPAAADANIYAAAVAGAANVWNQVFYVPIEANREGSFGLGALNLQAPEIVVAVEGTFGTNAQVVGGLGGGAGYAGVLTGSYEYWQVPSNIAEVAMPPMLLHRVLESLTTQVAAGDQIYNLPHEGYLARLIQYVVNTSAPLDTCINQRLYLQNADELTRRNARWETAYQDHMHYSQALPAGTYVHELWAPDGPPASGDPRDMINTERFSMIQAIISTGAVAPGVGVNQVQHIREILQGLQLS